jgi:hypothetical protein
VVGIFIVNNNPKTMAMLFLQPTVCMGSLSSGAAKSPAQFSRPGSSRTFGEYALLKDSRYMSQEGSWRDVVGREKV